MTLLPRGVKVHLAFGFIDMRKGIEGLPCWCKACCGRMPESPLPSEAGRSCRLVAPTFCLDITVLSGQRKMRS
jgi:hypothetical protein